MYTIYADNKLIYDDVSSDPYVKVASPVLTLEDNAAGSLKLTIPPGNAGYKSILRMKTYIEVFKDGEHIWGGRVLQEDTDFWNNRSLLCEGELAFLNDTIQPQKSYRKTGQTAIALFLGDILAEHNRRSSYQFSVGTVTVHAPNDKVECYTDYETTISCLKTKLLDVYGGHMIARKGNNGLVIDYLVDEVSTNTQTIEFGKNLMDFSTSCDASEYATVIIPLGIKQDTQVVEGVDQYLTVEEAIVDGREYGKIYIESDAVSTYGWIEKVVHWNETNDPDTLYQQGVDYLSDIQFDTLELELSALDLHYLNPEIQDVKLLDRLHVISPPHGMDRYFPVLKLSIPLDKPQNTIFKLGDSIKQSLTTSAREETTEMLQKIEEGSDAILESAKHQAEAIMSEKTTGYVTITSDEHGTNALYVSESRPPESAQRYWKWNMNGLGYTDDGGTTWKSAMLMDGTILGERIAAGSIHGSRITAGTLSLVSSAGDTECTLSLQAKDLSPSDLEVGEINASDGTDQDNDQRARTILRYRLNENDKITVRGFAYEVYRYGDSTGNFHSRYGKNFNDPFDSGYEFTVPADAYYRLMIFPKTVTDVTDQMLVEMADGIDLGESVVLSAADIKINGMVTFTDLSTTGGRTVIDGGNITTGHVSANYIDLKGLTITNDDQTPKVTFQVDSHGNVYIDGSVALSENSVVSFASPSDNKTLGEIAEEPEKIANGTYSGGTFINGTMIMSPTIVADEFIVRTKNRDTSDPLKYGKISFRSNADSELFYIQYYHDSFTPTVTFKTEETNNNVTTPGVFRFASPTIFYDGLEVVNGKEAKMYGNIKMYGGNIDMNTGKLILNYQGQTYGPLSNRPSNPVNGQLYFQTSN